MSGRLVLPQSNQLPEINRVLALFNRRVESLESAAASAPSTKATTTAGATSRSGSSGGSGLIPSTPQAQPAPAETFMVEFLTLKALKVDNADGLVAVDADGYAVFTTATIPFPVQGMTPITVNIPVQGGVFPWAVSGGFDDGKEFVNLTGNLNTALRFEISVSRQRVVFRNGTTGAGSLTVAIAGQTPPDPGILIPRNTLAWLQSNTDGSAIQLVTPNA